MKKNSFVTSDRSGSEVVTVYTKLMRFYLYNFFLKYYNYLLVFLSSIVPSLPLVTNIVVRTNLSMWNDRKIMLPSISNDGPLSINIIYLITLTAMGFSLCTSFGIFEILHNYFFFLFVTPGVVANLYFLNRGASQEVTPEEIAILTSVEKVKPYDIFIFEIIVLLLLHYLYLIPLLAGTALAKMNNLWIEEKVSKGRRVNPWILWSILITPFRFLSDFYSGGHYSLVFNLWRYVELSWCLEWCLEPELSGWKPYIWLMRAVFLLFCFFRIFYNNFKKMKKYRD